MLRFVFGLVVIVLACEATKTGTLDRSRLTTNKARAQLIEAAHKHMAPQLETCLVAIPIESNEILPMANRCICLHRRELAFLEQWPSRRTGLNEACADPTLSPSVNIHDSNLDFKMMCHTIGVYQRWAFCILF